MKIAAATEDGVTVSQHFGRAPHFLVLTVEDGEVTGQETRDKPGHHSFGAHHAEADHGQGKKGRRGFGTEAQSKHAAMAEVIADCQVLITGGMGWGAYENLSSRGINPIVTDIKTIDEAVKLYLEGKLLNLQQRLH